MKKIILPLLAAASLLGVSATAVAADGTWLPTTGTGNWTVSGNWTGGTIPGSNSTTTNGDTANFGTLTGAMGVRYDLNRNIKNISLANNSAFVYTFSTSVSGSLLLSSGGSINKTAGNGTDAFNNTGIIQIQGDGGNYTFTNTGVGGLQIATTVSGVSTAGNTTTLYLNGNNTTSNNVVNNVIHSRPIGNAKKGRGMMDGEF